MNEGNDWLDGFAVEFVHALCLLILYITYSFNDFESYSFLMIFYRFSITMQAACGNQAIIFYTKCPAIARIVVSDFKVPTSLYQEHWPCEIILLPFLKS